jgi:hypothetical protein
MTQLELVHHEQVIDSKGQGIRRTIVAVSSSHSALVKHCEVIGGVIDEVGCGKQKYYTIQDSPILILPYKF